MKNIEKTNEVQNDRRREPLKDFFGLILFVAVTFGVASLASQYEPGTWYQNLSRPSWTPPNWMFPVVWTLLYFMMSLAAWMVWRKRKTNSIAYPMTFYFIQLFLNGLWSWLFFGKHLIGLALLDIVLLWIAIVITSVVFRKQNRLAGALMIPYIIWVGYATALNARIWVIN